MRDWTNKLFPAAINCSEFCQFIYLIRGLLRAEIVVRNFVRSNMYDTNHTYSKNLFAFRFVLWLSDITSNFETEKVYHCWLFP